MAAIMDIALVRLDEPKQQSHSHGPLCGHMAVAHAGSDGSAHIGFLVKDKFECYSHTKKSADLCFSGGPAKEGDVCACGDSAPHLHAHRRTDRCGSEDEEASEARS